MSQNYTSKHSMHKSLYVSTPRAIHKLYNCIQFTKAVAAKSKSTNHMLVVHLVSQIYAPILFTMGA